MRFSVALKNDKTSENFGRGSYGAVCAGRKGFVCAGVSQAVSAAAVSAANACGGTEKPHLIISDDVIPDAKAAFYSLDGFEISECDFSKLANIDRAVRGNTVAVYGELLTYNDFRIYDYNEISYFARYFNIKLILGLFLSDLYMLKPSCAAAPDFIIQRAPFGQASDAAYGRACLFTAPDGPAPAGLDEINIDENFMDFGEFEKFHVIRSANARKLFEILKKTACYKNGGFEILYPDKTDFTDYKNRRSLMTSGGHYLKVKSASPGFGGALAACVESGLIRSYEGGDFEDFSNSAEMAAFRIHGAAASIILKAPRTCFDEAAAAFRNALDRAI